MNRRRSRWWLAAGLLVAAAASWPFSRQLGGPADRRPNVLLVTIDTLRRDHVSLYGYARETTPLLDAFFARGTLFEHATSPSPCTVPAVRQILSGARDFGDARPHLAELLQQHGYDTAAVVSQHHFRTRRPIYERGFRHFDIQPNDKRDHHGLTARTAVTVSNRAVAWLEHADERQPFFLWLHYFDPHDPYEPPPEYRAFVAPDPTLGGDVRRHMDQARERGEVKRVGLFEDFRSLFTPEQVDTFRGLYDAEIRYVDTEIDRVLKKLRKLGLLERTLVIFTADHGEHLGEDGRWLHCLSLHADEINVPLLLSARGDGQGQRVTRAVSTLDILPTVLKAAGVPFEPSRLDGRPLFDAGEERLVHAAWEQHRAVQDAAWKLVVPSAGGQPALYHIAVDPAERRDVAAEEGERVARMSRALTEAVGQEGELQQRIGKTLEELRAVGYVQ